MARRRRPRSSGRGRLSWDGRLWDPAGRVYTCTNDGLDRAEVVRLLKDGADQVVVARCGASLRWLGPDERAAVWATEIAPDFHDQPRWRPPADAPGQLPFRAELWEAGEQVVLLFTDTHGPG